MHQLIVHKYKEKKGFQAEIKIQPEETESSNDLKSNLGNSIGNQVLVEKSSKQLTDNNETKSFDTANKEGMTFQCNICKKIFSTKDSLKVFTVQRNSGLSHEMC